MSENTGAEIPAVFSANPEASPEVSEVRDPVLEFKGGVIASDAITLRVAARKVDEVLGATLKVPEIVRNSKGELFESLAKVTVEGLVVTAIIDTGKMTWEDGDRVQKDIFRGYDGNTHQSVRFQEGGTVVATDGLYVGRQKMVTPDGKPVYAWFAELQPADEGNNTDTGRRLTRYGILDSAQDVSESFEAWADEGQGEQYDEVSVPAAQAEYKSRLEEILEANEEELEDARQEINFALDYTGARARAKTVLRMRGMSSHPPKTHFAFGERGPVAYWFTGTGQDRTPFAVTVTQSEAWLRTDQSANFEF